MQQFDSFAQMQRDAAMRVMEMQKRAQAAIGNSSASSDVPVTVPDTSVTPLCEPEQISDIPLETEPETERMANHGEISEDESEKALITAILLLLIREKADERLIFALLYILI